MGTSNWQNISYCANIIRRINPSKVLDVGIGFGRWGILCRELLELWNGRIHSGNWNVQIDGVEVFEPNIEEYHKYFYTNIYKQDAYDFIFSTKENYGLIILGDVLEHFEKNRANELLNECLNKSNFVMINIPLGSVWEQSEQYGNKYEAHLSEWEISDFKKYNIVARKYFRDNIFRKYAVIVLSKDEKEIPLNDDRRYALRFWVKKLLGMK